MTKFSIFAVGSMLLFLMEAGFSLALQRYDIPGQRAPFFRGPITAALAELTAGGDASTGRARLVDRAIPRMHRRVDSPARVGNPMMKVRSSS